MMAIRMSIYLSVESDRNDNLKSGQGVRIRMSSVAPSVHARIDEDESACTLYPSDATGVELMSTWVSADAGSYVDVAEMR